MATLTPAIVCLLNPDVLQSNAGVNSVYLVGPTRRGKTKKVTVEEAYYVLPYDTLLRLPADMEHSAHVDVAEGANPISRDGVQSLRGRQSQYNRIKE